jgi:glycosyltransferase involved in cell wall biosynthesis
MSDSPLVSVCLITYNQEPFIGQSIESILKQETNFIWNLIIADDFSQDRTCEILIDYQTRFPERIKLIMQPQNKGPALNWIDLMQAPQSKYIAYIEGDDYWTDSRKLQKQIDFLEGNPDCSLCYTNALMVWEGQQVPPENMIRRAIPEKHPFKWLLEKGVFVPTCTFVFRSDALQRPIPDWMKSIYNGDIAIMGFLAMHGKFGYLDQVTAVYRRHSGGVINSETNNLYKSQNVLILYNHLLAMLGREYKKILAIHCAGHLEYLAFESLKMGSIRNFFSYCWRAIPYQYAKEWKHWRTTGSRIRDVIRFWIKNPN